MPRALARPGEVPQRPSAATAGTAAGTVLVKDINRACIVNDDIFLAGLQPVPFKIIEID